MNTLHSIVYQPRAVAPFRVGEYDGEFVAEDATGTSEPDATMHATRESAQAEVDQMNRQYTTWGREPAADAPHLDAQ